MSASDLNALRIKLRDGKAVGLNQTKKLLKSGLAEIVYIAVDADGHIREEIKAMCRAGNVKVDETKNMAALGQICGIDVDCAVYAVSKIR